MGLQLCGTAARVFLRLAFLQMLVVVAVAGTHRYNTPLFTKSSWIVDSSGARVQLACVSWAGHMEAGIPEGLSKNTVDAIAKLFKSSGFNCVRLTSSTWVWTEKSFGDMTVAENFQRLDLTSAIAGIRMFNPQLLHKNLRTVHTKVVATLAANDIMVILDNHVSKPKWCCSEGDGNGFWGDEFFDVDEWLQGLVTVATIFRANTHVVGMSLRNELRGPKQNSIDWQSIVPRAAAIVHVANPNVLVIAGGLSYASDLGFLGGYGDEIVTSAPGKFMYEFHWYKWFARGSNYDDLDDTEACARNVEFDILGSAHSHQKVKVPHFLSEFGVNQATVNYGDGRFLDCVIEYLRTAEEPWALWALQGSYYLRNGVRDLDETYGVLDSSWHEIRNPELIARLRPIQGK